jgi:glycine/D-amino acid oxidase-like deaminating enzyme
VSDPAQLETRLRSRSLWLDALPGSLAPRRPLEGDRSFDVVIVGGGYTGLWTAYSLVRSQPNLMIAVVEAETCGFGASGRNGGFVSAGISGQAAVYERRHGLDGLIRAERAMVDAIDVIGSVVVDEEIDCGWVKGGALRVAMNAAQLARVDATLQEKRRRALDEDDIRSLDTDEIRARLSIEGVVGGTFTPHCARINPAALARGLADTCERSGVSIYEQTRAIRIEQGAVVTNHGVLRGPVVIRATEAYTTRLPGRRRSLLPLGSHMIATEPLPAEVWSQLGWGGFETLADQRHHFVYAQRTPDGRIALGGRGLSYRPGSRFREADEQDARIHVHLEATLRWMFPAAAKARVTHRWGGVFAAPRDWSMGLGFDRETGLGWGGGYSGHGVVASHLAGRTLADLVLDRESELTALPWVGHAARNWEPEPLRWLGARGIAWVLSSADSAEDRTGQPARRSRLVARWAPGR